MWGHRSAEFEQVSEVAVGLSTCGSSSSLPASSGRQGRSSGHWNAVAGAGANAGPVANTPCLILCTLPPAPPPPAMQTEGILKVLRQSLVNYISPMLVIVSKVLLKHCQAHSFRYYLRSFGATVVELSCAPEAVTAFTPP